MSFNDIWLFWLLFRGITEFSEFGFKNKFKKKHVPFHKCGLRSGCKMPKCVTLQGV